jgi:soluble lytic murein transglycosylase
MTTTIIPEKRRSVYRLGLPLLALALAALALTACHDTQKVPAATATSESTPVPTPVPADLMLAANLERNGQYDEATAVYQAVVDQSSDAEKRQAHLALARLDVKSGDYQAAHDEIVALQSEGNAGPEADFLLAQSLAGLGQDDEAVAAYSRYIDEGGAASANAHSESAYLLLSLGRLDEAEQSANAAIAGLPDSLKSGIILSVAQGLESADATGRALAWYQRLHDESDSDSDKALALQKIGSLKHASGASGWQDDLQQVIATYPISGAASDALAELQQAGVAVDPYLEALVHYRHFENDQAVQLFQTCLAANPDGARAAAAHYYLAALDERLGGDDAALQEYAKSLEIAPSGDLADDALWWSGLIFEKQSRWQEADDAYGKILAMSNQQTWTDDASFRHGMVLYKQKRYQDAATAWHDFASQAIDEEVITHAFFWAAKAELAGGQKDVAATHFRDLAQTYPLNYYGLRAASLLSTTTKKPTPLPAIAAADDTDVQSWLAKATASKPVSMWSIWLDPRWAKAQELYSVGFPRSAAAEMRDLMWSHSRDPMALWALAQSYHMLGLTEMSSRSAELILQKLSTEDRANAPKALLRLAYPDDYAPLLQSAQDSEDVSPVEMLALMRQESFFDPLAGSGAGATGLTQVIPSTAEGIATDLGDATFTNSDLFRPVVSIQFGAYYLAQQLNEFDGNLYYALAAYNAGPGAVEDWRAAAGNDIDMFLEQVDVGEANLYVRLVMENLAVYRYLYEDAPRPSLPQ